MDDAKLLFEKIKSFSFFQNFFSHYIKDMDMHSILALCRSFSYERFSAHDIVMKQKDPSNDKFYVILSGDVAVCVKSDNLGKFGEIPIIDTEPDITFVDGVELHKGKKLLKREKKQPLSVSLLPEQIFPLRNSKRHSSYHSIDKNSEPKSAGKKVYHKSIFAQRAVREPMTPDEIIQPISPGGFPHGISHFSPRHVPPALIQATQESRSRKNSATSVGKAKSTESTDPLPAPPELVKNSSSEIKPSSPQLVAKKPRSVRKLTEWDADTSSVQMKKIFKSTKEPMSASMTPMQPGSLNYLDGGSIWGETDRDDEQVDSLKLEEEKSELEILAEQYGRIVTYLHEGESFGEVALKRSIPRTATILCKTDCEFIVIKKEQYDLGFGRMQKEKEEFLLSVFPMMKNISSTLNYNYLIYNFKTERHLRGTYLINEGKVSEKEAKFYLIQHGECIVEKILLKEIADPYDLQKKLVSNVEKVNISVAGKGVIVGEELLVTGDEYLYGIRVLSELAIVQAITKKEFEQKFPSEFHRHVKGLFEKKKAHRESIFEQIKKENINKLAQFKNDNAYSLKNRGIKDYLIKPALQGFNKYINRGNKLWDDKDPILAELHNPDKNSQKGSRVLDTTLLTQGDEVGLGKRESAKEKEEKELLGRFGIVDTKQNTKIASKIEFLNKISDRMIEKTEKVKIDLDNPFILDPTKGKRDSINKPGRRKRILSAHPTNGRLIVKEPGSAASGASGGSVRSGVKKLGAMISQINIKDQNGDESAMIRPSFITEPVQINSARLDLRSSEFKIRSITDNEFKSLYSQTLSKGSAHRNNIHTMSNVASPAGSMNYIKTLPNEPKTAEIRASSRDSFKRNLYVSTLATEPNSSSKAEVGSFNFLKASPRLSHDVIDSGFYDIKDVKSLNSLSYIPSYADKDFKNMMAASSYKDTVVPFSATTALTIKQRISSATVRPSNSAGIKTVVVSTPTKEVKRAKMKASDANLHKVKEWRQKIFKKPERKPSEADIKNSRGKSAGAGKAW